MIRKNWTKGQVPLYVYGELPLKRIRKIKDCHQGEKGRRVLRFKQGSSPASTFRRRSCKMSLM